ncbi:protocadherin-8 [Fukomys damarensis]|uniref:protocadherin-8 n=1 Tax=Fukomys damarensis TaxID=885580 RepID=UPI001455A450|nr:protocadherin-8 [Fukomys damarensis]
MSPVRRGGIPCLFPLQLFSLCWVLSVAQSKTVRYSTFEEDAPGTVIGTLAEDLHMKVSGDTSFRLMKQFNSSLLRVREGDGQLTVGDAGLDRERLCGQAPQCVLAFDVVSFSQEQFRLVHVEVEVRDVNDHAPRFPRAQIPVEVSEGAAVGTRIPLEVPVDEDVGANGLQTMRLTEPNSPFRVELPYTVRVGDENDNAPLFTRPVYEVSVRENNPPGAYLATVAARDPDLGRNGQVTYRLLEAELRLEVSVRENNPPGAYLATVAARDPDLGRNGQVTYRLLEAEVGRSGDAVSTYVSVDPATGAIYALRSFDYEMLRQLDVRIQASDSGTPQLSSSALVQVRVLDQNDHAPVLVHPAPANGSLEVAVPGRTVKDTAVARVQARDADEGANGELVFDLQQQEPREAFSIGRRTGEIVLTGDLSQEPPGRVFRALLVISDGGRPLRGAHAEPYGASPGFGKEPAPPVAVWKGHSFNTISGREAEKFSGKDSGKGDSDFNDSDSDISGDALKKDLINHMQSGLWACTAECKILGHSDRCWSPSCGGPNAHPPPHPPAQMSTFCKSTSLPRDPVRRDNYYQAQLPKTVGLQSVYEKVLHRDYDRTVTLLSPPRPGRLPDLQEIGVPLYQSPPGRYMSPKKGTDENV